jgi:hypothetical protein
MLSMATRVSLFPTLCVCHGHFIIFSLSFIQLLFLNNNHKRVLINFVIIHLI